MIDREKALLSIRPLISTPHQPTSEQEKFQNNTLRPILKFQNKLILALVQQYSINRKIQITDFKTEEKKNWIRKALQSDPKLKSQLEGIVLGHLSLQEWKTYQKAPKAYRKRLTDMIIQRLHNQIAYF